jgi:hypothetical protein
LAGLPAAVISFFLQDLFPKTFMFLGIKGGVLLSTYVCTYLIIGILPQKMKGLKHVKSVV